MIGKEPAMDHHLKNWKIDSEIVSASPWYTTWLSVSGAGFWGHALQTIGEGPTELAPSQAVDGEKYPQHVC